MPLPVTRTTARRPSVRWPGPISVPAGDGSLPHRLSGAVVTAIARGELAPGDALPSTRALATQVGVGRGVVVHAYDELAAAGYVEARRGSGTVVLPGADVAARAAHLPDPTGHPVRPRGSGETADARGVRSEGDADGRGVRSQMQADSRPVRSAAGTLDLRPGHTEPALISDRDWRAAWRQGIPGTPGAEALSRARHPELEAALADHLRRMRGLVVSQDEVVVVPGASAAFRILSAAAGLADRTVALEDPGYRRARAAFVQEGARVRPVPVDDDGLDPALLHDSDAAVYVTPAHHYPLGARMPVARRVELVERARAWGQLVVEDDYDGEFRYGVPPLPALRSIRGADACTAYVGTASKILTPDLGLAWLVPPRPVLPAVREAQDSLSLGASPVAARALAHLIDTGALGRHLARAARLYHARRDALVAALSARLPDLRVSGVEAGLHLVLLLADPAADDRATASRLLERGIRVEALSDYYLAAPRPGLVIGYARLPESRATDVARAVAAAVAEAVPR